MRIIMAFIFKHEKLILCWLFAILVVLNCISNFIQNSRLSTLEENLASQSTRIEELEKTTKIESVTSSFLERLRERFQ